MRKLTKLPFSIRAVDSSQLPEQMVYRFDALLRSKTSLAPRARRAVADAFIDAKIFQNLHASGASRVGVKEVDLAIAKFDGMTRMEIKSALAHAGALAR
jgi:hypothetical protein